MSLRIRSLLLQLAFVTLVHGAENKAPANGTEPKPPSAPPQNPGAKLTEKMNNIILPVLHFKEATIEEALKYLRTQSRELDKSPGPSNTKGVNIILRQEKNPEKTSITLDLKDVPLSEALRYVTELSQTVYRVEAQAVIVSGMHAYLSEMHTRTYKVPPDFLSIGIPERDAPADPFASIQPPEPSNGKIPRRSAKQILQEAVGNTFPEGASALFNPTTSQLTVTNNQPNLDLVETFVDSVFDHHPDSIVFVLTVIEGPGDLIRQVSTRASHTSNVAAELTSLLDQAKQSGSKIRVVADAFIEGTPGQRYTSFAGHMPMVALGLDAKSRTSTWNRNPLGLRFGIGSTKGADANNIETTLALNFRPIPPLPQPLLINEAKGGHGADLLLPESAGVDLNTTTVNVSGATKFIGVTRPASQANEKSEELWAFFLTSTLRRVGAWVPPPQHATPTQGSLPSGMVAAAFHSPPGMLESLMKQPRPSLRQWLEKDQDIAFPPGSLVEQRGDELHVINIPSRVEAIGALIVHAESVISKTVAITLHTIEAPATLLRDLSRQSIAAGADDTAMFTTLDTAAANGGARFINSLFFETKSGVRATHESVRACSFISNNAIKEKSSSEIIGSPWQFGLLFEIKPIISASGQTMDLNFGYELHSPTSETSSTPSRDSASDQSTAMSMFHIVKTGSNITMARRGTKLIALHLPAGRDAQDKLWATFLRCEVVPQFGKTLPTSVGQAPAGAELLITKNYRVPIDFLERAHEHFGRPPQQTADPFAAEPTQPSHSSEKSWGIFAFLGVTFPEGASTSYNPTYSKLVVRNTPRNLALIEAWLDEIKRAPSSITLTTHIFQAPGPLLRRLTAQAAGKSDHRAELNELLAAVKTGQAQSLGIACLETKSGTRSTLNQGTQHRTLTEAFLDKEGPPTITYENRNVGFNLELEPTIRADGATVELTLSPEYHTAPPLEHREHIIDTQGRRLEFPLTDYFTAKTTTSITIPSGSARLLSLYKPTGKPEFEKDDILQAIFITCDILRASE